MKKIYSFFVALVLGAILFVACEPQEGGPDKQKEDAIQLVDVYVASYGGQYVENVSNDYWMAFMTDGLEMTENGPIGEGQMVYLEIFPASVENNFPVGKFALANDAKDGFAWAGWEYDYGVDYGYEAGVYVVPQGCFVYEIENDVLASTKYMESGYVEIKGSASAAEVFVDVTFDDGTKAIYCYTGKLEFLDSEEQGGGDDDTEKYNFNYEPTEAGEYDVNFDICQVLNGGDVYSTGTDYIKMSLNSPEWVSVFDLFAPLNSGENAYGTYTIVADSQAEWTGVPSLGGDDWADTPSYFGTDFTADGYYTKAFYVASGTVVIAENSVNIDIVSHYGSKIKATYEGEVEIKTEGSSYVSGMQQMSGKRNGFKLVKATVADVVYFDVLRNYARK